MNRRVFFCLLFLSTSVITQLLPASSFAQIRDWNDRYGVWSDVSNWNPNIVPNAGDLVRIGNLPAAHTADVELDVNTAVLGLQIFNGMRLQTDGHNLATAFDTLITGSSTRSSSLQVQSSIYSTRDLTNEARLRLSSGTVNISRRLDNAENAVIFGGGTINFTRDSGIAFRNNGRFSTNGSPFFTFNQLGGGLMDLDGTTGNGQIRIQGIVGQETVTFNGTQLADAFSGRIDLRAGNVLNMNFSNGWTADAGSEINLLGNNGANPSQLQGGNWTMNGSLSAESDNFGEIGEHDIEAATIIGTSADVFLESQNRISFQGPVTIQGGNYVLEEDAELSFNNSTVVNGGQFQTFSQLGSDGLVRFGGLTAWQGDVAINGIARQNGNALVTGETTINAGVLDMDGGGSTNWTISNALTVNTSSIDSSISNSFDGTMTVTGGASSRLAVNLDDPTGEWTMAGEMDLINPFNVGLTRVEGSRMRVTGDLNLEGKISITADLSLENSSVISFANPESNLLVAGTTVVAPNSMFVGEGELINSASGDLTLADGASLNDIRLDNYGTLRVGSSPGIADVSEFENRESGIVEFEIGGYGLGSEYDFLIVSQGEADLDGLIDVSLIDTGEGLFVPEVGDEFTVLTALAGVNGEFDNAPVTVLGDYSYNWEVIYNQHDVTLRLDSISVPEPSAAVFLLATTLPFFVRRRRR